MNNLFQVLLLALLVVPLNAQQITLKGKVSIHNSQYETGNIQYVQNAYVSATFAGVVGTDANGNFSLIFSGIEEGTSVKVTVEKVDLEIVNKKDLLEVVIGRLTPLKIYLAPKGQIAKARVELYDVSIKMLTERHDRMIADLKKEDEESQRIIKDLEVKLNVEINNRFEAEELLNKQLAETKRRLPEFTQRLAKVNLDFASEMYRKAYEYFKEGEIEKAIETIDEAVLDKQANEAVGTIHQLWEDLNNLDTAYTYNKMEIHQLTQSYYVQALSLDKQGKGKAVVENLYKAIEILSKVTKGKDYNNMYVYANAALYYQKEDEIEKEFYALQRAIQVAGVQIEDSLAKNSLLEVEMMILLFFGEIKAIP